MIRSRLLLFFLSTFFLTTCKPVAKTTSTPGVNPTQDPLLPVPIQVIPTPSKPDTATVTGYLFTNQTSPRPVVGANLSLAAVVPTDDGTPYLVGFDRVNDPRTQTDINGQFVFKDIPVGKTYALVLDRILNAFLLNTPKDNKDMLVVLKAGEIYDFGKLIYSSLPGEPE